MVCETFKWRQTGLHYSLMLENEVENEDYDLVDYSVQELRELSFLNLFSFFFGIYRPCECILPLLCTKNLLNVMFS